MVHGGSEHARNHKGNKGPRLEFEQKQLDGENDASDRRVESGRHSSGGSASEQHFALGGGGVHDLADERTDGAAGLDDRSFGAKRAAGADGDGGGDRLQDGDLAAAMRLRLVSTASIASGMPCPLIL